MPIIINDPLRGRPREPGRVPASTSTVLTEQFAQTFEENPIAATKRFYELRQQERHGTPLAADSARERVRAAGMESELQIDDAGITEEALETLMERKRTELRRRDIFSRAQGGAGEMAGRFGVALATTLADPISAGLNFVPIVGQARYAKWLSSAGGIAARTGVRAGVGAAEGAVGAALVEPFIYASRRAEQADYDAADSLLNVAFGGVTGTAMHTTVGTLGELASRRLTRSPAARAPSDPTAPAMPPSAPARAVEGPASAADIARAMRPQDFQAAVRAAVGQVAEGRAVDVDGIVRAATRVPEEERLIQRQLGELLSAREAELLARTQGDEALLTQAGGDVGAYTAELQRSVELRDEIARQIRDLPRGDPRRAELMRQQEQAQRLMDSRQQAVDRINRVRAAETDLEQLRYARSSAKTVDDLIDALPSDAQAAFRRRVELGRQTGEVRGRGSLLQDEAPTIAEPADTTVSRETAQVAAQAEEVLAREPTTGNATEKALAMAKEEASLAEADLRALEERLGVELKSDEYDAVKEAVKMSERWAKTAELATVCLTRGG